jgi:hypothetical protein
MAEVDLGAVRLVDTRRITITAAIVALVGFIALAIGLAVDPERTWLSYVMAYSFAVSVSVGGLILSMAGYATNASWVAVVRRAIEMVALPLPALAVLFVPLLFGLEIYPWHTTPPGASEHTRDVLAHRAPYMNTVAFAVRGALYFFVLLVAGILLRRWSVRRDGLEQPLEGDPKVLLGRDRKFASAMLPPVALALTFAMFDWVMSLQPVWYSSMFGFYVFAGGFVAAIGLATVIAYLLWSRNLDGGTLSRHHFHALGRLQLAFTVFWGYIAFFQAMLIRIANKPEEVTFYLQRVSGAWSVFVLILIIGHFALPFLFLLLREPKFRPRLMAISGGWLAAMNLVDYYWLVVPSRVQGTFVLSWLDLAALAAVLGASVAVASRRQHGVAVIPVRDPFLIAGIAYRSKN